MPHSLHSLPKALNLQDQLCNFHSTVEMFKGTAYLGLERKAKAGLG